MNEYLRELSDLVASFPAMPKHCEIHDYRAKTALAEWLDYRKREPDCTIGSYPFGIPVYFNEDCPEDVIRVVYPDKVQEFRIR